MFVNYQCKDKKFVCPLSIMHASSVSGEEKKKPHVVLFYNQNKVTVNIVDQMVRMYSTRCATRRWPVGVWCNVLDLAAQNSRIIYKKSTEKKICRKQFILELVEELRSQHTQARNPMHAPLPTVFENNQGSLTNKRKKCHGKKCTNATLATCKVCSKRTCGKCAKKKSRDEHVVCTNCSS